MRDMMELESHRKGRWAKCARVRVSGELTSTTWSKVALFEVYPQTQIEIGMMDRENCPMFHPIPIKTQDGQFGIRLNQSDLELLARSRDPRITPRLRYVFTVNWDDPKYPDLPVYFY